MTFFGDSILQLIIETSTNLPNDVRRALANAKEQDNSAAAFGLQLINQNINISCQNCGAICQDTGMLTFAIHCPPTTNQLKLTDEINLAVEKATSIGKLRPNGFNSLSGENSKNNLNPTTPIIHYTQWKHPHINVRLILKGGGSENQSTQYSLPCELDNFGIAERDLNGVKKCILHAVWKAQGYGCAPGFLGVAIGADRSSGYSFAKEQLFRSLDDKNEISALAKLEDEVLIEANKLNIGAMGLGGQTTLLGCKIGVYDRIPASFFVSIAYNCWALRRLGIDIDNNTGKIIRWYEKSELSQDLSGFSAITDLSNAISMTTPLSEETVRNLKVGDIVLLSGTIFTARDAVHKFLSNHDAPVNLTGQVIYHCGPVMRKNSSGEWTVQAAGPTTSYREEPYQAKLIEKFGISAIIGKGGMGPNTAEALQRHGAVYLHAIGGAAQVYAQTMGKVTSVFFLDEFGAPEAMWQIECKNLPSIVTMDANGNSLHQDIAKRSCKYLDSYFRRD